ncbi:hypothetical protein HRbin01_00460 [archaeon HR01]|nr:hypothetical protein HRbin01_00460 [archaeon HR01]
MNLDIFLNTSPALNLTTSLVMVAVALALIFIGRKIAKVLAFIAGGIVLALLVLTYLDQYLGGVLTIAGAVVGFLVGGVLAIVLLRLGIGIAMGIISYYIAVWAGAELIVGILVGLVFFAVGFLLADKILSVITAVLGALIAVQALIFLGLPFIVSLSIAVILAVLGMYVQLRKS